jgi:hypothetical protein
MDLLLLVALLLYLAGAFQAIIIFATKQKGTSRALFWTTRPGLRCIAHRSCSAGSSWTFSNRQCQGGQLLYRGRSSPITS